MKRIKTIVKTRGEHMFPRDIDFDLPDKLKWIPSHMLPAGFCCDESEREVIVVGSTRYDSRAFAIRDHNGANYEGMLGAIEIAGIDYRDICRPGDMVPLVMGVRYEDWQMNLVVDCWDGPDPKIHEYDTYQLEDFFACGDGVDGAYRGPDIYGVAPNVRIAMPDSDL
jgi:hypothetical protein